MRPIISILIAIILLGFLMVFLIKKEKRPTDYYNLFLVGMIWVVIGIPMKNYAIGIIGLVFLIVGLINKDKWKTNHKTWNDLTARERRITWFVTAILAVLVILGLITFLFVK